MIKKLKSITPAQSRITDMFLLVLLLSLLVFGFLKIAGATSLLLHNY